MIYSNSIVENNSIFLKNLDNNATSSYKTANTGAYGIYAISYSDPLIKDHIYYYRATYKYTTTNQSPTWVKIYSQGGYVTATNSNIANPVANTEYTLSGYSIPSSGILYSRTGGMIYNGNNNAINGVTSSVKESVVYDVTYLYEFLKTANIISSYNDLVAWCNSNLEWKAPNTYYDITSLLPTLDKVGIDEGILISEAVECDGMQVYSVSATLRNNTYFDTGSGLGIYNNKGNGTVTHTRVSAKEQNSPFYPEHEYVLQITTNGEATPGTGGFIASHTAKANNIFIERFVAKIPVGYNITSAYNSQGTGASVTYLTSREGTGDWAEYAILYRCGSSGSFSSGGHVYLSAKSGYSSQDVIWYLAYANNCNITEDPNLMYYTALPKTERIKGHKVFSYNFDNRSIFPNGDGANTNITLPSGWSFDKEDVAGNAKASYVQAVGGSAPNDIGGKIAINPHSRYKISMWVKCKQDMSSYLVAIIPYTATGVTLQHATVVYTSGTKTTLKEPLNAGDTQMTVASNANWKDLSYGRAGFRSNQYTVCHNDLGLSHGESSSGFIAGVEGSNIVKFKSAYNGTTIPTGTVVVESRAGGVYPYPIQKASLPTDNTWKYVEGYFGAYNANWDGASTSNSWEALPTSCTHIGVRINLYSNTGSVPIKFSDIKIEEIGADDGQRHENKVQIKKYI